MIALETQCRQGVALITDVRRPYGVTLAFTERQQGVSKGAFTSLNLGGACGDAPEAVRENRSCVLSALDAHACADNLINPHQVHGDKILVVRTSAADELAAVRAECVQGADAIVCCAENVPVLLCFADCVPVILAAPKGFAVVHSGWRGTLLRIASKAVHVLTAETGANVEDLLAYIGPHIGPREYEVSQEVIDRFTREFGSGIVAPDAGGRHLDLGAAVRICLTEAGVLAENIAEVTESTAAHTDRFFSYRAEQGQCGRHGAVAVKLRS